jgi:hypothetical protein
MGAMPPGTSKFYPWKFNPIYSLNPEIASTSRLGGLFVKTSFLRAVLEYVYLLSIAA